ncbi:MAG TPA: DUF192 domain-containing protein [Allosphingosinicella sp.]|uniref:DUF192 domain-containing protein n=1 Tax=Allosphingosinicella sp. TaxID=2823234 RepID=UPI002ED86AAC
MKKLFLSAAALSLLVGCRAEPQTNAPQQARISTQTGLPVVPLQVQRGSGVHRFTVEVAATEEQQATGLMFVERLDPDKGMVFPFTPPRPASFWMKNTLIPLDMIFVRPDCSIARVAVNTVPHSLAPVGVEENLAAVLEIAGGRSVELGIAEGDCVSWPGGPAARR